MCQDGLMFFVEFIIYVFNSRRIQTTLLCLLAKIKCSICSYRVNRMIAGNFPDFSIIQFLEREVASELARASSRCLLHCTSAE